MARNAVLIGAIVIVLALVIIVSVMLNKRVSEETEQTNVDMLIVEPKYEIVARDVTYAEATNGYLAQPQVPGNYPGVIMIHEWWGLNDHIKQMAEQLAAQGYTVLAVDLYNGEVAANASRAGQLATSVRENPPAALANMQSAIKYLQEEESTEKIASLGWCFGGGQSLQISMASEDVDATVIYYGALVTHQSQLQNLNGPVLGIFGEEDTSIPVATVNEFDSSLDTAEVENEIYIYEGVGHAFANPSGMNYAPEETKDAWSKTLVFLREHL